MQLVENESDKRCLIVDDEEDARFFSRQVLEKKGYNVAEVSSGSEAIRYISEAETLPHVILLDQLMPGIDGITTLKEIRQIEGSADIKVIITTSLKSYQLVIDAMQNGASDFVVKPMTPESLGKSVERAFHQRNIKKRSATSAEPEGKHAEENIRLETVTQVGKALTCEMGSPLQAILALAEMMSKGDGGVQNRGKIERNVEKILSILDKFTNATSVKASRVFMDDEMIDIRTMESLDVKRVV